jgi:hypothetical protein
MIAWTIYRNPSDYPFSFAGSGFYVARAFVLDEGEAKATGRALFSNDLDKLRALVLETDPGLISFPRNEGDEPQIVETWL